MAENGTKARVLFLERFMLEHTDDNHSFTTEELIHVYEENGYSANRNTIRDDIEALNASGIEILGERVGNGKAFHIGTRLFELPELKMLVDAVSSSHFITKAKSELLIEKLAKLTNKQNRSTLTAKIFTSDRVKTSNTTVFYTTDTICRAIEDEKRIRFRYWNYNSQKEHILRRNGEWYEASPYALIWDDERYYLTAFSESHGKIVTFRVDRMCDVEITEDATIKDDSFNIAEYAKSTIRMMDENLDEAQVVLICDNQFMQNVVDRFSEEVITEVVNENCFRAYVTVRPSKTFFSWVVGFGGGMRIAAPTDVKQKYERTLQEILSQQETIGTE